MGFTVDSAFRLFAHRIHRHQTLTAPRLQGPTPSDQAIKLISLLQGNTTKVVSPVG